MRSKRILLIMPLLCALACSDKKDRNSSDFGISNNQRENILNYLNKYAKNSKNSGSYWIIPLHGCNTCLEEIFQIIIECSVKQKTIILAYSDKLNLYKYEKYINDVESNHVNTVVRDANNEFGRIDIGTIAPILIQIQGENIILYKEISTHKQFVRESFCKV